MNRVGRSAWVAALDSPTARRITGSRAATRVLGSGAFEAVDNQRRRLRARLHTLRDPHRFDDVESLCVFIGHVKSGGTMLGSLLDAHPHALVSDEVDLLHQMTRGFSRAELFHLIERSSQREADKGRITARRLEPYSFAVPGLAQGQAESVRVLGDVRGGPTTRRAGEQPELLDRLAATVAPTPLRYIHAIRDPFDPISATMVRGGRTPANAIDDYEQQCHRLVRLRAHVGSDALLTVRYEQFVAAPVLGLERVCRHVGLDAPTDYLDGCAAIIDAGRPGERHMVEWKSADIDRVHDLIERFDFLEGYRWV
ncbi:MAG: sulfotransferase [Actinomycetota bacterium]